MNNSTGLNHEKKSSLGYFYDMPSDKELREIIPCEVQRNIWIAAFKSLELINHNFVHVMEDLFAYSNEMATYRKAIKEAGDNLTDQRRENDTRINPLLVLAQRSLSNAMALSKVLGLDPISRQKLSAGPEPERPKVKSERDEFM